MSDWKRTTKEVGFENLRPELSQAIKEHIEKYNLGKILSDALMYIQTDSEKIKKGLFGGAEAVYTGAVVTPRWLIWAMSMGKNRTAVVSAQLKDIVIEDYAQSPFANLIPDSGLNVSGKFTGASESPLSYIALESNAVGDKFTEIVIKAAQEMRRNNSGSMWEPDAYFFLPDSSSPPFFGILAITSATPPPSAKAPAAPGVA